MQNGTDEIVNGKRKLSVTFERKLDLGDYNNVVARAWIEDEIAVDATDQVAAEAAVDMLNVVKVAVYDTLGIEVFKDDDGVIREKQVPKVTTSSSGGSQSGSGSSGNSGGSGGFSTGGLKVMNPDKLTEDIPQYIIDKCAEKGIEAVWVNHGKFGAFYKEAVSQGDSPKIPDKNDASKAGIIKSDS